MKFLKAILPVAALASLLYSCDTETEALEVQKPYTYSDLYYQNLRDYKNSDHEIAWCWFSDYSQSHSLALRFLGLPDSVDVVSLWGGIPSQVENGNQTFYNPAVEEEMRFCQKVKGMKLVVPTIIRIEKSDYKEYDFYQLFQQSYNDNTLTNDQKIEMRHKALELYADYLMAPIWENDLDGIDLDYEPEGDRLSGDNMIYFCEYIGKFFGPKGQYPDKLFCIDFYNNLPPVECAQYANWLVNQTYSPQNGKPGAKGNLPMEKLVFTENVGDAWSMAGGPKLKEWAVWEPEVGHKGGFGGFYIHRDYNVNGHALNTTPYQTFREAIQLLNPAVY